MLLAFVALLAGILTVLSPCVLPVLPVILGSGVTTTRLKSLSVTVGALLASIFAFTILLQTSLKFTPVLATLDENFWRVVSGSILTVYGLTLLFPDIWSSVTKTFHATTNNFLSSATQATRYRDILIGVALGPVFTSCSPTYFVIVALLTGTTYIQGLLYLGIYLAGLGVSLFTLGLFGRTLIRRLGFAADSTGPVRKLLGALLIFVGLAIITGLDKDFETYLIANDLWAPLADLETKFL